MGFTRTVETAARGIKRGTTPEKYQQKKNPKKTRSVTDSL